jgi:flavodoxin
MKATIIYGTNSGSTLEASTYVQNILSAHGVAVRMVHAADATDQDISSADLVIFGSCTWDAIGPTGRLEGQMQEHFLSFRTRLQGKVFPKKPIAVFGLGDRSYTEFCAAADKLAAFVKELQAQLLDEPLRIDGFYFHQDESEKKLTQWTERILKLLQVA